VNDPRIIVALDYSNPQDALDLSIKLDPGLCRLKVGKELFTAAGPVIVEKLQNQGFQIFLDLKYHDIPNTVASACKVAAQSLGVWMLNVHAMGGRKMLMAAREAISQSQTKLIAVTLLTSMDQHDVTELGWKHTPQQIVSSLAQLTYECGLDGVVCSAQEARLLRTQLGADFCLVTPGIRLQSDNTNDQKRITTPRQAISDGASYLVIGRPITQARDPLATLQLILQNI